MLEKCWTLVREPLDVVGGLLVEGSRAVLGNGDLRTGRERYEMAYRLAQREGDAEATALAALGLGGLWVHEHRTAAASARIRSRLRHALSLLEPDSPLALRIRARLVAENDYPRGEHSGILAVLHEARASADPMARAEVLNLAHHCLLGPEHNGLRHELAVELIEHSFLTERRGDLLMGILWQTVDLLMEGDTHAKRRMSELRQLLATEDHLAVGFVVNAIEVMLAIRGGHLEKAEELARCCLQRGIDAGGVDAEGWHGVQLVAIRWYQGRLAEMLPELDELLLSPTLSAVDNSFRAALAVAAALSGDHRKARSVLASLSCNDLSRLPRSSSWLVAMNGIAETAFLLGDRTTAAQVYQLLAPYADMPIVGGMGIVCFGSAHQPLGVAAMTTGELDVAVRHFRAAIQHNLALAHWPAVVASRKRLAQALSLRGRRQDVSEAHTELAAAKAEAVALGMDMFDDDGTELSEATVTISRQGRHWRIEAGERSAVVDHSVGMLHLAVLVANPRQEVPAIDLVAGMTAVARAAGRATESAQMVLDREAMRAYRRRVDVLHAEIDEAESRADAAGVERARAEREWLERELSATTKIGGRARSFTDDGERARIAVGKAIRRALARITHADRLIGDHLREAVHTGVRCSYWPI